ncbi:MAG: riboflavin synthase, partial [Myxococcales bacterium]|nr:riboflavin synthase [Myxococcales bacterium]
MFTGIVEELGAVRAVDVRPGATGFAFGARAVLDGVRVGDSIAVNGVCLTVTRFDGDSFEAEAVPETLRRSNLGALRVGSPVNLERALAAGRPMGGHYVQGHVDTTAELRSAVPEGEARNLHFALDPAYRTQIVPKGFVAVDGASLTVVDVTEEGFTVTLVPHTQGAVVFGRVEPGYVANVEVDVMGKYVAGA